MCDVALSYYLCSYLPYLFAWPTFKPGARYLKMPSYHLCNKCLVRFDCHCLNFKMAIFCHLEALSVPYVGIFKNQTDGKIWQNFAI